MSVEFKPYYFGTREIAAATPEVRNYHYELIQAFEHSDHPYKATAIKVLTSYEHFNSPDNAKLVLDTQTTSFLNYKDGLIKPRPLQNRAAPVQVQEPGPLMRLYLYVLSWLALIPLLLGFRQRQAPAQIIQQPQPQQQQPRQVVQPPAAPAPVPNIPAAKQELPARPTSPEIKRLTLPNWIEGTISQFSPGNRGHSAASCTANAMYALAAFKKLFSEGGSLDARFIDDILKIGIKIHDDAYTELKKREPGALPNLFPSEVAPKIPEIDKRKLPNKQVHLGGNPSEKFNQLLSSSEKTERQAAFEGIFERANREGSAFAVLTKGAETVGLAAKKQDNGSLRFYLFDSHGHERQTTKRAYIYRCNREELLDFLVNRFKYVALNDNENYGSLLDMFNSCTITQVHFN